MKMVREWMNRQKPSALVFQLALILGSLGFFSLMAVYAFQGSLTRYMADDYCNAVLFSNDAIGGLVLRYMRGWGGNRYSNIWLVGISEIFFSKHVGVLPVSFLMLWAMGLVWMMTEIRKLLNQNWSFAMSAFLGLSIAFFSLLQVTNLYQTIYWRSSMTTHFAPIVCGTFLLAYLIRQARNARTSELGIRANGTALAATFLLGGFSEPTDAVQITVLTLALGA
ncbi:MAG TPA: hypothetical protein VI451_09395, partial [Anaerolineales bacterium]|nr:hypothetical protein [Anaerolineales bacterium]